MLQMESYSLHSSNICSIRVSFVDSHYIFVYQYKTAPEEATRTVEELLELVKSWIAIELEASGRPLTWAKFISRTAPLAKLEVA